jgi:hypothetical protein
MKKNEFKKLFNYVEENEKSSVEFQSVWRKAHRRNWQKRLFQSAGHNLAVLLTLLTLTPILGYYVIDQSPSPNSAQSTSEQKVQKSIYFSGKIYNFPNQIVIKGESDLPQGTVIKIELLERDGETVVSRGESMTKSDGAFQYIADRLDRGKEYIVMATLNSHNQNLQVKKVLGSNGENLWTTKNRNSTFQYHHGGEDYYGLKLIGIVNKIDDTNQHVGSTFLMTAREFEELY